MTLILSGTDGLSDVDGTAATPAIRGTDANTGIFFGADIIGFSEGGVEAARINADSQFVAAAGTAALPVITTTGDTNTGIFFPAADTIGFAEGGAEAMRIDSDGDVGIGTSSPSYKLHVVKGASDNAVVIDNGGGAGDNTNPYLAFSGTGGGSNFIRGRIRGAFPDATAGGLVFETGTSGSMSERMRIDSSGNLLVGRTTQTSSEKVCFQYSSSVGPGLTVNNSVSGNGTAIQFSTAGSGVGNITTGTSSTAYNTSSDYRLKNTIAPMTGALAKVALLKPVTYKWNIDGSSSQGFIAHELQEVVPDCVNGEKDAVETYTDEEGNEQTRPKYQGIDTSFLVATLTAAIQELKALTDTQASTIQSLTTRITALEQK